MGKMKKIIGLTTILCMIIALMSVSVSAAAEPNLLWDFGVDSDIEDYLGAPNSLTYEAVDDYFIFTATGNDPYIPVNISVDDVSKVLWAKARVKNPGPATAIELFGATNGRSLAGPECTHIDIAANSDEWLTYIIYIPDENVKTVNAYKAEEHHITEPYWEGTVEFIRLDAMWQEGDDGSDSGGSMANGDQIYIDYIAFFATEADAQAFRAPVVEEEVIVEVAAEVEESAPVETTPVAPAPVKAPQTSDTAITAIALIIVSVAIIVTTKKRK